MIKINLLASASASSSSTTSVIGGDGFGEFLDPEKMKSEAIKRVVIILLFPLGLFGYEYYKIPLLEKDISTFQSLLTEKQTYNNDKQKAVEQIKIFQDSEKQFQNRITTLESLSKIRQREVDVLNLIQTALSDAESVNTWIRLLEIKESKVNIIGFSSDDSEVTTFIDKLSKSIFFSRVVFQGAVEKDFGSKSIKEFTINCDVEKVK